MMDKVQSFEFLKKRNFILEHQTFLTLQGHTSYGKDIEGCFLQLEDQGGT